MKIKLNVNLKIASGKVISSGTVFDDKDGPIPDFVMRRVARNMAEIIDTRPSPVKMNALDIAALEDMSAKAFVPEVKEEVSPKGKLKKTVISKKK
jgi:hypothetical protein